MRAQATVEFLFVFAATITVMSMLAAVVLDQNGKAQEKITDMERIHKAESAARAVEAWMNTGIEMKFGFHKENVSYRIEGSSFHVTHNGSVIEIRGIFESDDLEPL